MRPFSHLLFGWLKSPIGGAAVFAVVLCGFAVSACNGPTSSLSPMDTSQQRSINVAPLAVATATPTPIPFTFQTVDDPASNTNQVNGINQLGKIVGVYGAGQSSSLYESYTSQPTYSKFVGMNYPGSQGTFGTSLSSNKIQAGYVIDPNSLSGTWGFVRINGLWTLLEDPNEGTGNNAITEIWGLNDSEFAVGYYVNASGTDVPFELQVPTETFTDLRPPGATAAGAMGINGRGDISGWETTTKGTEGFFLKAGTYYAFTYPSAKSTYALSVNWQQQVGGYYVDTSGMAHGFVLTSPTHGGGQQVWQSVDEPNAVAGTWITGLNNHDDICGYYVDGNGARHGFVAVP